MNISLESNSLEQYFFLCYSARIHLESGSLSTLLTQSKLFQGTFERYYIEPQSSQ